MATFENVHISLFGENGQFHSKSDLPFRIEIVDVSPEGLINVKNGKFIECFYKFNHYCIIHFGSICRFKTKISILGLIRIHNSEN